MPTSKHAEWGSLPLPMCGRTLAQRKTRVDPPLELKTPGEFAKLHFDMGTVSITRWVSGPVPMEFWTLGSVYTSTHPQVPMTTHEMGKKKHTDVRGCSTSTEPNRIVRKRYLSRRLNPSILSLSGGLSDVIFPSLRSRIVLAGFPKGGETEPNFSSPATLLARPSPRTHIHSTPSAAAIRNVTTDDQGTSPSTPRYLTRTLHSGFLSRIQP